MRLYRPPIPLEVKCRVAMVQLGEIWPEQVLENWRHDMTVAPRYRKPGLGKLLVVLLGRLAPLLGCEVADLRLDHNPALGLRKKRSVGAIMVYTPDANDPGFMLYRSHQAHHIKTNVRGDGAQFSDTALMKRERRRKKKAAHKRPHKKGPRSGIRVKHSGQFGKSVKATIPARANPWPPRGSRPFPKGNP